MVFAFIIIGAIFGGFSFGFNGIAFGAVLGFLLGRSIVAQKTIDEMQATIRFLKNRQRHFDEQLTEQKGAQQPPEKQTDETPKPVVKPAEPPLVATKAIKQPEQTEKPAAPPAEPAPDVPPKPEPASTPGPTTLDKAAPYVYEEPAWWRAVKGYFTGGNTLVRVGIVILFIGMAFLAKYAAERGIVPIEYRMMGLALTGLALLVVGWRLRHKREGYALALQGGGIGITYLTIFASFRLYHLLPPTLAFSLMLLVCVFSAALAILMNARSLAILGFSFGFLAPVLTSTGGGSHVMLFSYYTILNFGVLGVAWYKSWRALNLTGFVFTFVIGTLWGVTKYKSDLFASTEPFLVGFFLFYVAISVLYAVRQPVNLRGYVDGTLVFGTPIIVFGLQTALVKDIEYGLAYSALALFVFYVLLATGLFKVSVKKEIQKSLRLLCESFLSIGVVFGTVAIPLALDDQWTAAAWALEGAALTYIAVRQQRDLAYFSGLLLQFGSALFVFRTFGPTVHDTHWPIINGIYINGFIMAVAGLISAFVSFRYHHKIKRYIQNTDQIMLVWGVGWWLFSGIYEIHHHTNEPEFVAWFLVFGALTAVMGHGVGGKLAWPSLQKLENALIVFMVLAVLGTLATLPHPFSHGTWLAWVIGFAVYYVLLKRTDKSPMETVRVYLHGAGIWLATLLLTWEAIWQVLQVLPSYSVWWFVTCLLLPCAVLIALQVMPKKSVWPFSPHKMTYYGIVSYPIIIYLLIAVVVGMVGHSGDPTPLPYLPFVNPLDMSIIIVILAIMSWWVVIQSNRTQLLPHIESQQFYALIGGLAFLLVNSILIKTIHHWYAMPLTLQAIIQSDLAQTSMTILWSVIAMAGMLVASKRQWRSVWIVGGGLLTIVVAKLFLVDLSNVGTVERIVSFIFVGGLMLVIGYFTPIPPRTQEVSHAS